MKPSLSVLLPAVVSLPMHIRRAKLEEHRILSEGAQRFQQCLRLTQGLVLLFEVDLMYLQVVQQFFGRTHRLHGRASGGRGRLVGPVGPMDSAGHFCKLVRGGRFSVRPRHGRRWQARRVVLLHGSANSTGSDCQITLSPIKFGRSVPWRTEPCSGGR